MVEHTHSNRTILTATDAERFRLAKFRLYGKPDYQASEMVIGESERVMGIKDDAWGDGTGLEDLKHRLRFPL